MNKEVKKFAEQAGFCFWTDEPHKPKGAEIDWASKYDEQLETFYELVKNDTELRMVHRQNKIIDALLKLVELKDNG